MKPNQEPIEDRLMDALLTEQSRRDQNEALRKIEAAIDHGPASIRKPASSRWPRRSALVAASLALGAVIGYGVATVKRPGVVAETVTRPSAAEMAKAREAERIALAKAIRNQEDKVEERRKVLATIVRTKGIIYKGSDSFYGQAGVDEDQGARSALQTYHQLEQEKMQLDSQLASLQKYDDDQLMNYASGLDLPDNVVREAYPEYLEAKRKLEGLKVQGLGDGHPEVQSTKESVELARRQLDEGVQNLEATLMAQHDLTSNRLKSVEVMRDSTREEAIKRGLDAQDYVDAKREFEMDQQVLMEMKLKQAGLGAPQITQAKPVTPLVAMSEVTPAAKPEKPPVTKPVAPPVVSRQILTGRSVDRAGGFIRPAEEESQPNTERYAALVDPAWQRPEENPLSTFSIDVDNASYSNIRRMIREGRQIPADAVRIEECVNAFDYQYATPTGDEAFAVHTTLATCPWNEEHALLKVGIKGREIAPEKRPVSNLVFLIDVSGSMQEMSKLPLVKESLKLLIHQLDERDSVSYVVYAGSEGVVLPPTKMTESGRVKALDALDRLEAGGSTNGGAGIQRAYAIARENFIRGGVNRVILATDGDFNVGVTNQSQLVNLVKERAAGHVYLSILGFGSGNLNDSMLEAVSKDGNGNYYYIDGIREGRKVFLENLSGTLVAIAKDVKIQIEFNPQKVGSYRLIGYANRVLKNVDFNNDKVDAGDIGAGHTVTAFYEIIPAGVESAHGGVDPLKYQNDARTVDAATGSNDEWLTLKLRHKHPEGEISALQESVVEGVAIPWQEGGADFQFAAAVAMFGMKLRGMEEAAGVPWERIRRLAAPGLADDAHEDRAEFIGLLKSLEKRMD